MHDLWFEKAVKDLSGTKRDIMSFQVLKYSRLTGFELFLRASWSRSLFAR